MFDRSLRYLNAAATRGSPRYLVALLACILLALVWRGQTGSVDAAIRHPVVHHGDASGDAPSHFDALRNQAATGDELSNVELSNALMDRYDLAGDSNDLYEALQWVERRWDPSDPTDQVNRIVAKYCSHRVVQWHWLCVMGE
ncbi:hypothetical protein [Variovorax saccharolyticus]|uniref:hypothetical protein n=1 Tax=Variovorax saccharolyticus TaxID=3053516 RepID=UPI002578A909|nr:hypothetical protein [Variovorax sp. J31P216]MDM0028888.1 hypothetical protein [Variovorax sp. J31P216]